MSHKIVRTFFILMLIVGMVGVRSPQPVRAAGPWYVSTTGDDSNDCLSPDTPCATINGTLGKADFLAGDNVLVAAGTYTGTGNEVVLLNKDASLSGGWDDTFTAQNGMSIIDAESSRRGLTVNSGITATLERFTIQHGELSGGMGTGDGILNEGVLTLNRVHIRNNGTLDGGGGIVNEATGILTLNNSAVTGNGSTQGCMGGIFNSQGSLTINNSTVSDNASSSIFCAPIAGIANHTGPMALNNVTVANNTGGGIWSFPAGVAILQNTLVAGNTLNGSPYDCNSGDLLNSLGYNLIGAAPCTVNSTTGDQIGTPDSPVDAHLGPLTGSPGYHPLYSNSPAIDAGNPAGCEGSAGALSNDQRGAPRVGVCDIGAYEYTVPGAPASIVAINGTPQRTPPFSTFSTPLGVVVFDDVGTPVQNVTVSFSAPSSGVSGTFLDTGTATTASVTDRDGLAAAPAFTANGLEGSYSVTATVAGVATPARFQLTHFGWYVSVGGDNSNDCQSPASACATVGEVFAKPGFIPGDTILLAGGVFTGTGEQVILLDQSVRLLGGWNNAFITQAGTSIVDGEHLRKGIRVDSGVTATIERLTIQNGSATEGGGISLTGGGIYNGGNLSLNNVIVSGNHAQLGGGIANGGGQSDSIGNLTIENSWVHGNSARNMGGGIYSYFGRLTVKNSTVSSNTAGDGGGGIYIACCSGSIGGGTAIFNNGTVSGNTAGRGGGFLNAGSLSLNSSTVSSNTASGGGIDNGSGGTVTLQNSILAGNLASTGVPGPDCTGPISSSGFNLLGNSSDCAFTSGTGDLTNVDPNLGELIGPSGAPKYRPLLSGSPAIDAGNPAGCRDDNGDLLGTDQRGVTRVGTCDMGAYEFTTPGLVASLSVLNGDQQITATGSAFPNPLQAAALDSQGSPVSDVAIDFTAPGSGASGTFTDTGTNTISVSTNPSGVATTSSFTANDQAGAYTVVASASGVTPVDFNLTQVAAPANDNFAEAELIPALPFAVTVELTAATTEPNEPQGCSFMDRSVWYSFIPTETMLIRAVAAGGVSSRTLGIWRSVGPGILDLQFVGCATADNSPTFLVEAQQTYYFQVGATNETLGSFHISLERLTTISGRVTDSNTGSPLPGDAEPFASVVLRRCNEFGCFEFVNRQQADSNGRFHFFNDSGGTPLPTGTYQVEASANLYETHQSTPFDFIEGQSLDLGDIPLTPIPVIGSISGRLVDEVTGKPVSPVFAPALQLYRCTDGNCFEFINSQVPDSQGLFRFETDFSGNPLPVGTYQVVASAEQYQQARTDPFEVGEGIDQNLGDFRITSFPVRFSDVQPCADLPASGGECSYSVRIWNGLATRFSGKAWSLVNVSQPDTFAGPSDFQPKDPTGLALDKGKSKVIRFSFKIPASSSSAPATICNRMFVGQGNNFRFNTVGFTDLFCFIRNTQGLTIVSPQSDVTPEQPVVTATATGTDIEPNNSCQAAQDVGPVTLPFVLDGNLDSTQEPDIDFFRFSGTAGVLIGIDHEGEPTGKGTLADPLLALFDSNCNLIALSNDTDSANARIESTIPSDGIFILAATAFPDFEFTGGGNGSYQLTVAPIPVIGSIRGRVLDANSATPLRGDVEPFAFVRLVHCDEFSCTDVNAQETDNEGRFLFENDFNGGPLRAGNYQLFVFANQYREGQTEQFTVGEAEDHDVGDFALISFPVRFSDIQPCSLPADGGVCNFSVKITNGLSTRLSGKAWSMVNSVWIGSFTNFTSFQTGTPRDVKLNSGKSSTLRFSFHVPASVADGAMVCAWVYVGQNPGAFFNPVGISFPFCFNKGAGGFSLMSSQEAQALQMQTPMLRFDTPGQLTEKKK
jgi:5-hydroxyisourate hydrolase-like protein (transthyretin family)